MLSIRSLWLEMKLVLRLARQAINEGLKPLGLTGAEGDILFILLTGSDKESQEMIAEQLDIGKAAVSRVVGSLEKKGYVIRIRQKDDNRAYSVSLTEKARSAGVNIVGIYENLYRCVKQDIADEDLAHIGRLLESIALKLHAGRI